MTSLVKLISSTFKLCTFIISILCLAKLANSCQKNDKHAYAALCWQAVAKCEESMGHNCEQALAHQKAALQFFSECKKTESSGLISPYDENLQVRITYIYQCCVCIPDQLGLYYVHDNCDNKFACILKIFRSGIWYRIIIKCLYSSVFVLHDYIFTQ